MSARLETLHESLTSLQEEIETRSKLGQPFEDLAEKLEEVKSQIKKARKLLVESNSSSVLKD